MRNIILISGFIFLLQCLNCSHAIAAGPWKGKVIDIETKEPLDGAVVLAVWQRVYRTPYGSSSYFYNAKEVLTDKDGRFEIPSYRPINLLPIISVIREPEFTIFKPGYLCVSGRHLDENIIDIPANIRIDDEWYKLAPGVIELPTLKTREERIRSLHDVETIIDSSAPEEKFKDMLRAVDIENRNLGFKK